MEAIKIEALRGCDKCGDNKFLMPGECICDRCLCASLEKQLPELREQRLLRNENEDFFLGQITKVQNRIAQIRQRQGWN